MYRLYGPKLWITAVAYVVLAVSFGIGLTENYLKSIGLHPSFGNIVFCSQIVIALVFLTPAWRLVWRIIPKLNDWVFPDLNGEWVVEVSSNWPRIERLAKAASGAEPAIDFSVCKADLLPQLSHLTMRARITQSWSTLHIYLWNPNQDSSVEDSDTFLVEPVRGSATTRPGLIYFFRQRNKTDEISDDPEFLGATRLEILPGAGEMKGVMWTNRMWRRGMNTAASIVFKRA